jgi:hypothetical protein
MYFRPASCPSLLDQHRQIDTGDHLDFARAHGGNGKIGRRSTEHVRQNDHAGSAIGLGNRCQDIIAPVFHIVVRPDANRGKMLLPADNMFDRVAELVRQPSVRYQHESDHQELPSRPVFRVLEPSGSAQSPERATLAAARRLCCSGARARQGFFAVHTGVTVISQRIQCHHSVRDGPERHELPHDPAEA